MQPRDRIQQIEAAASLPSGGGDRFAGYAVIGLPLLAGHVLYSRGMFWHCAVFPPRRSDPGAGDYGAEYFGSLWRRIFQQEAGVSHHSRKQIIEIVSNAAGEQANAFQFLGLAQALLGSLSLSNIDKCSDGSTRLAIFPKQRDCVAQHVLVSASL